MSQTSPVHCTSELNTQNATNPKFSSNDVKVIFMLGGPGAGKGTQSELIVRDFTCEHISAGDLLRIEQDREGSPYADLIKSSIRNGIIVPKEVTIKLLEITMTQCIETKGIHNFIIDGFPRKLDQALAFEKNICRAWFTIFLDCPESQLTNRILQRGKTSGRTDDNIDSIQKRMRTYVETTLPVIDLYRHQGRLAQVDASASSDEVYAQVRKLLIAHGILPKSNKPSD